MLNEKKMSFDGASDYSIQGVKLAIPNLSSCSNGTLHAVDGKVPFLSSIYESLNNYDYELDSISAFIKSYDEKKIDEKKIEAAITEKTKAICVVHYAGVACEMDTIMEIAKSESAVQKFKLQKIV